MASEPGTRRSRWTAALDIIFGGSIIAGTLIASPLLRRRYNQYGATDAQTARRLPTPTYLALGRCLVRAADQYVIDAGGLVGRHVGGGVKAFFLAESVGSESAAAAACIRAAWALRSEVHEVATRSDLPVDDVVLRFGLHWGSTLHGGNITTGRRTEVTALGDEGNEAARIEACATGGRALTSKSLIERLNAEDAAALDIDPDHVFAGRWQSDTRRHR